MKHHTLLAAASVIALIAATPVLADSKSQAPATAHTSTGSLEKDAKKAWEDIKDDTAATYESIKATMIGDDADDKPTTLNIDSRKTAGGMIGKPVVNGKDEKIGVVKDIILNNEGDAQMVIVADADFPGISGKLVAMDYSVLARQNADGDVLAPLTEEMITKAKAFSYDKTTDANTRTLPANSFSAAELLKGELLDQNKKSVAYIDEISLRNGQASQIIVAFDQVLGMGGERAALDYDDVKVIRDGNSVDFQLSANQAVQFENYKKTVTN